MKTASQNDADGVPPLIRVGDLPVTVREPLLAFTHYAVMRPDLKRDLLLSDSFWKTARVLVAVPDPRRIVTQTPLPETSLRVYVGGQDEIGHATTFFSPFDPRFNGRLALFGNLSTEDYAYPSTPAVINAPLVAASLTPVVADAAPVVIDVAAAKELGGQAPLQALVSLEVKRQPLAEVLSQASKQSGVTLSHTEDVSKVLITARVEKMPLHELMGALARLCGASWRTGATGYELQGQPLQTWQKLLLRSGQGDFEGFGIESQFTPQQLQPLRDLEQAIADEVSQQQTPQGVPVSALSEELQAQLKQTSQAVAANTLVRDYMKAFIFSASEAKLSLYSDALGATGALSMADGYEGIAHITVNAPPQPRNEKTGPIFTTHIDDEAPAPDAP